MIYTNYDGIVKTQIFRHSVIPACAGMTEQGAFYGFINYGNLVKTLKIRWLSKNLHLQGV